MNGCMSKNGITKQLYLRFPTTGGKGCMYPYSKRDNNNGYQDTHISFSVCLKSGLTAVKGF